MANNKDKSEQSLTGMIIITKIISVIIGIIILAISRYAFTFFILAIMPSITAVVIDKRSNKFASSIICAFNITGIMPYLSELWNLDEINDIAKRLISDIHVWFGIYGTTSLGWIMIWAVPQICGKVFQTRALVKINQLKTRQLQIVEEWGPEVKSVN